MRVQGYDRAAKDDNGSKELVNSRNRNTFLLYFIMNGPDKFIYVSLVFVSGGREKGGRPFLTHPVDHVHGTLLAYRSCRPWLRPLTVWSPNFDFNHFCFHYI